MTGALLTAAGFWGVFGVTGWDFLSFSAVCIFFLSIPLSLLGLAFRETASSSLSSACLIGCINGLICSTPFLMTAAFLGRLITLPSGGVAGAAIWFVRRQLLICQEGS